jgi:hypothetical protein
MLQPAALSLAQIHVRDPRRRLPSTAWEGGYAGVVAWLFSRRGMGATLELPRGFSLQLSGRGCSTNIRPVVSGAPRRLHLWIPSQATRVPHMGTVIAASLAAAAVMLRTWAPAGHPRCQYSPRARTDAAICIQWAAYAVSRPPLHVLLSSAARPYWSWLPTGRCTSRCAVAAPSTLPPS